MESIQTLLSIPRVLSCADIKIKIVEHFEGVKK